MNQSIIEEAYVLKKLEDSKNIRHRKGTNEYTFDYNYQWRNIYNKHQQLGIRSVKLWKSPRYIFIDRIPLIKEGADSGFTRETVNISGTIIDSTFDGIKSLNITHPNDIGVKYNILTKSLTFQALGEWKFDREKLDERKEQDKTETDPMKRQESEDFKAITGRKFADGIPYMISSSDTNPKDLQFDNVWDREDVHVYASFSDLATDGFLGVSNEQFIPPKQYPINNNDQKFKLFLYDKMDRPIELASDGKDTLIVEAMMISY